MKGFYERLKASRNDDTDLEKCIEKVVNHLINDKTSGEYPGMLLGKIQSGKTRGFLGIITRAFDQNFDIALVLTKGTKTLAKQTVKRISSDFKEFIDNEELNVYDIMEMPERMMRCELKRKIVIVVKKEANNLSRVFKLFSEDYPELAQRKVLLVDDEADMASIRFVRNRDEDRYDQGAIAQQMDNLRNLVSEIAFLQVTATPYALYLQPQNYEPQPDSFVFLPKRPTFTELLPIHSGYVGGDDYFGEFDNKDPQFYLFVPVPIEEQNSLRTSAGTPEEDIWLVTNNLLLRQAFMTFLTAVVIRRWQQALQGKAPSKFVMVIHNDTQRSAHNWQSETIDRIKTAFEIAIKNNDVRFLHLYSNAYKDLKNSVTANKGLLPSEDEALEALKQLIKDEQIHIQRVNSDVQLAPLLDDETAELKLRTHANIFIGGSILDRGITIPSMISFYYGRNPKRMQADTVLQHSRMYGNRDKADLAVTRFYTSEAVYSRLEQIHKLETALREAFEKDAHAGGVIFIQNDANRGVIPCAPSKVSLSDTTTMNSNDFYYPNSFDTKISNIAKRSNEKLTTELLNYSPDERKPVFITKDQAIDFINLSKYMITKPNPAFDWKVMTGLIHYYCKVNESDQVLLYVETGRELDRYSSGNKSGLSIIGRTLIPHVRGNQHKQPILIMLQQGGTREKNWTGDTSFWWPVLVSPSNAAPCIFTHSQKLE